MQILIGGGFNLMMNLFLYSHTIQWVIATLLGAYASALWNYHLNRIVNWEKMA
jgi:putative flippase GtrA